MLTAEAREESLSRRTPVCNVQVTDAEGTVVALFRGTAFRKDDPITPLRVGVADQDRTRFRSEESVR